MNILIFQNKKVLIWVIIVVIMAVILGWVSYRLFTEKRLQIVSPDGREEWRAGSKHRIAWKARNVGNIQIVLIKGEEPQKAKIIAQNISARNKKYDWEIFAWEETSQNYKIAIFEYPWQEGNKIDYSDDFFTVLGPQFASCDELSIGEEWPFVPSDFPNLRKVFITKENFSGNLEGVEGADKKCQSEAQTRELAGTWKAFLGNDFILAVDRLNLEGIFVQAESVGVLPEGKTCHRLLGKDFEKFFKKLSAPLLLNQEKLEKNFLTNFENVWLGKINKESKRECTVVLTKYPPLDPSHGWSFTTTCQNWTTDGKIVAGYPPLLGQEIEFPVCYTPLGIRIRAVGLAGLASGLSGQKGAETFTAVLGKSCDTAQKLLCIQQ